jgi:hypothetical protein
LPGEVFQLGATVSALAAHFCRRERREPTVVDAVQCYFVAGCDDFPE